MSAKTNKLDTTGLKCPLPVLRVRRTLEGLHDNDILEVTADDPTAVSDIPKFCQMAGHHLLMAEDQNGQFVFQIQKGMNPNLESENNSSALN